MTAGSLSGHRCHAAVADVAEKEERGYITDHISGTPVKAVQGIV